MGKVMSIMIRQSRRVFAHERAERVISKPKPTMHPYYPTEEKVMQQIKAEHPELEGKIAEHRPALDERVGSLRITSKEIPLLVSAGKKPAAAIESGSEKELRLLPQQRMAPDEPEFGFHEPPAEKVHRGRILFTEAVKFLQMRDQQEEDGGAANKFAKQRGMSEADAKRILEYFAPFTLSVDTDAVRRSVGPPKPEERLEDVEAVGRRGFLHKQQERVVSPLEAQRITARAKLIEVSADHDDQSSRSNADKDSGAKTRDDKFSS